MMVHCRLCCGASFALSRHDRTVAGERTCASLGGLLLCRPGVRQGKCVAACIGDGLPRSRRRGAESCVGAIARANVKIWAAAGKAQAPIRVEQKDALEFEWPVGPCVVFLFNPFDGGTHAPDRRAMAAVFRNRPSDLEVLVYKPNQADALPDSSAWCGARRSRSRRRSWQSIR